MAILHQFNGNGYKGQILPVKKKEKKEKPWVPGKGSRAAILCPSEKFQLVVEDLVKEKDNRLAVVCHLLFRCVRVGDAIKTLKISDLFNKDGSPRRSLDYVEEKTGKNRIIPMTGEHFKECLVNYYPLIQTKRRDAPLFYNRKHNQPITPRGIQERLMLYVGRFGLEQLSPHSFRKGGARHMWESGARIETVRDMLNHHSTKETERYICITAEDVAAGMVCFKF